MPLHISWENRCILQLSSCPGRIDIFSNYHFCSGRIYIILHHVSCPGRIDVFSNYLPVLRELIYFPTITSALGEVPYYPSPVVSWENRFILQPILLFRENFNYSPSHVVFWENLCILQQSSCPGRIDTFSNYHFCSRRSSILSFTCLVQGGSMSSPTNVTVLGECGYSPSPFVSGRAAVFFKFHPVRENFHILPHFSYPGRIDLFSNYLFCSARISIFSITPFVLGEFITFQTIISALGEFSLISITFLLRESRCTLQTLSLLG